MALPTPHWNLWPRISSWLSEAPIHAPLTWPEQFLPATGTVPNMKSSPWYTHGTNSRTAEATGLPPEERTLDLCKALYLRTQDMRWQESNQAKVTRLLPLPGSRVLQ